MVRTQQDKEAQKWIRRVSRNLNKSKYVMLTGTRINLFPTKKIHRVGPIVATQEVAVTAMESVAEMENSDSLNRIPQKRFLLQWHVTARCEQECKHCYVFDNRTYAREIKDELSLRDCKKIIDSLIEFCRILEAQAGIVFTGGDPLLRPDFFHILKYAFSKGIRAKIMGNPFHLDLATLSILKKLGVWSYQLSLDGMEETHDRLRKPGSFQATIQALHLLKARGMRTVVMFTLGSHNAHELLDVMTLVSEIGVDVFAFARLAKCSTNTHYLDKQDLSPQRYRDILISAQKHSELLLARGVKTNFNQKDHLWKLLLYEQGKWVPKPNPKAQIISGCHIGRNNMTVLADGTVFACRRFNSPVGRLPKQSIFDVFVSNELKNYSHIEKFEKCSTCPLLYCCRGCPAVAFASTGNYYGADPQCWKD